MTEKADPLEEALKKVGVRLEKKPDVHPVTQMLGSGLGGIAGSIAGGYLGLGVIGRALVSLGGAVAGHVAVTYNVRFGRESDDRDSPMAFSDRR